MPERPLVPLELRGSVIAVAKGPHARPLARLVNGNTTDAPPLEVHDPEFKDVMRDGERLADAINRYPVMLEILRGLADLDGADLSSESSRESVRSLAKKANGVVGRAEDVG